MIDSIHQSIKVCWHCGELFCRSPKHSNERWLKSEFCSKKCSARRSWTYKSEFEWAALELLKSNETPDGCLEFKGGLDNGGYGLASVFGKKDKTHRHIFRILVGEIPENICVCHKCDNPKCINPDHLFLGTKLENNHDKINKGRARTTSLRKIPMDKKSIKQVIELSMRGLSYPKIGEQMGITGQWAGQLALKNGYRKRGVAHK